MVSRPRSIVVLTGAGISAESGIETFRAAEGLWANHHVDDVATLEGFARNPQLVYTFYNQRRRQLLTPEISPNAAHSALAKFEHEFGGEFLLVTQNVDNLHERAGSENLIHMHGELLKMSCLNSKLIFDVSEDFDYDTQCRCCRSAGNLRPHVVWFGEMPLQMNRINRALENCDMFVAIGTSGNVYPASGFYQTAKIRKARTVELNLERTGSSFDQHICGPATESVPQFFNSLLRSISAN
ncbi:MAG: Sir2 family NAD+-dependent deacetylase [Pseudomonadota bacterium]|nr:Sir2 family NAD+-dependent deacetylase [Pseudomonadota bacterium]MEC8741227.1 Sir2 family NAD+-dependent deacetylase [Pseudomonadota bacterium]MEC9085574.1 Sir2 family NAD+-dependent deacetylase [Pseudomonadota bacterium]MEE3012010.1 Sir2 family NAD+-dependent deacetylase [Pseudomonadota bacterium]